MLCWAWPPTPCCARWSSAGAGLKGVFNDKENLHAAFPFTAQPAPAGRPACAGRLRAGAGSSPGHRPGAYGHGRLEQADLRNHTPAGRAGKGLLQGPGYRV
ncbi:MAG: hypothetical protein C0437_16360, partial [Ralstonia sp.]|nr:hypothetical protein [Ralstonia sp.]